MKDKINHIFAGALIASAVGMPAYLENDDLFAGIWSALVAVIIVAATKEWCDGGYTFSKWSWADFFVHHIRRIAHRVNHAWTPLRKGLSHGR